ncbi:beta-ketoacyl-ACP synthase III [Candidatus Merdisoma sp. HCP28S3_D10]|uniref:beta-ketoacyl-ACP synthase III n=1 Tax=unclassified Candidatus Merdisoma TaxID=3099611 RepID=UPI003F8C9A6E
MTGVIKGTGSCVPGRILTNEDLTKLVDTSDAWIQERTGIRQRHIAVEETTVSLAAKAARRALADARMEAGELDLLVVSTISPTRIMPCTACEVQAAIGAGTAFCFDISAACSGFVAAWNTVCAYMAAGLAKKALIVGSECLSRLTDWTDRSTCVLFGDGAGAVAVEAEEGSGFLPAAYSDGAAGEALTLESLHAGGPFRQEAGTDSAWMKMDGQAVFKFAVRRVPQVIEEVLEKNRLRKEDISHYVLHQANRRIVEAVAKRLQEPLGKFSMNLQEYGNTSSASIPILLDELNRSGELKKGERLVLAGFGGGLTWGAAVTEWKKNEQQKI